MTWRLPGPRDSIRHGASRPSSPMVRSSECRALRESSSQSLARSRPGHGSGVSIKARNRKAHASRRCRLWMHAVDGKRVITSAFLLTSDDWRNGLERPDMTVEGFARCRSFFVLSDDTGTEGATVGH